MRYAFSRAMFAGALLVAGMTDGRADEPLSLRYFATWGGGAAANIVLRLEEDGAVFRNRVLIETVGLARLLSGFRASASSEGARGTDVTPHAYDAIYDSRRRQDRRIDVQFIPSGTSRVAEDGPQDSSSDPLLPEEFRRNVIDPLSALTAIRDWLRAHAPSPSGGFTVPVYDGKRRFDLDGQVQSIETTRWGATTVETVTLQLRLRPIAGFDEDEGENRATHTREVVATFTKDMRAIPLRVSVPIAHVPAVVVLDRDTRL